MTAPALTPIDHLLTRFSQSVSWNAFAFIAHKLIFTATSFLLYRTLSTTDFSLWNNLYSYIFLSLLWLDFGLRRSVTRYWSIFCAYTPSLTRFTHLVIAIRLVTLILWIPAFLYLIPRFGALLHLTIPTDILIYSTLIFIAEGLLSLLKTLYHAHFLNRQFNLLLIRVILIESLINLVLLLLTSAPSSTLVRVIIITKLCSSSAVVLISCGQLLFLLRRRSTVITRQSSSTSHARQQAQNYEATLKEFLRYSGVMWMTTNARSLSERNFMVPLITFIAGPAASNLFKVANDASILCERAILKSIDTSDTALLAHVQDESGEQAAWQIAFTKVSSKLAALCFPVIGALLLITLGNKVLFNDPYVFTLFILLAVGHVVRIPLVTYERVLEVRRRYDILAYTYLTYVTTFALLTYIYAKACIGLLLFLTLVHGVRLVSMGYMALYVTRVYSLTYPSFQSLLQSILFSLVSLRSLLMLPLTPILSFLTSARVFFRESFRRFL